MKKESENKEMLNPFLIINGINHENHKVDLKNEKIIIGRLKNGNDIVLDPDPQKLVTRYMHCSIEFRNNVCWLIDNNSKNGTFLKRNNIIMRVQGQERLYNHDIILILAKLNNNKEPQYWELEFDDPQATEEAFTNKGEYCIEYDWVQAKLFLVSGGRRKEVEGLTPQEHKLLRFMDERNKNNNYTPVMCTYEEIISAIWEEYKETRSKNDVNHLVAALRKKIEIDIQNPKFLQNIRGMGYRFISKPDS